MSSDDSRTPTYPGGIDGLLAQMEGRLEPLTFAPEESLPPLDADLEEMAETIVPAPEDDPLRAIKPRSTNGRKFLDIRAELAGKSELAVLHGLLIAHLRKRSQPDHCAALFHRMWEEQAPHLMAQLNPRWQVSAITTFGDHGLTAMQRQLGLAMSTLFGTMKLYESERRYSGRTSDQPFPLSSRRSSPLPMDMDAFAISAGGLDVNMLGRLWKDAESDAVIKPLAHGLLDQLIYDPRTVFRRLRTMRSRLERKRALTPMAPTPSTDTDIPENIAPVGFVPPRRSGHLKWGVVTTTDADLSVLKPWAAHHLSLGANQLYLYLEGENSEVIDFFSGHTAVTVTVCNETFWDNMGQNQPDSLDAITDHNATHCLKTCDMHFLARFDVSEYLISSVPVARGLGFVPKEMASARMQPIELLSPTNGDVQHFKRATTHAGVPKGVLEELYPNFGPYLNGGFTGPLAGRVFARTGIEDTDLTSHELRYKGAVNSNQTELPRMSVARCHGASLDAFQSYAAQNPVLKDFIGQLPETADADTLFQEVSVARPELLAELERRGMLVTYPLDLDSKVAEIFDCGGEEAAE